MQSRASYRSLRSLSQLDDFLVGRESSLRLFGSRQRALSVAPAEASLAACRLISRLETEIRLASVGGVGGLKFEPTSRSQRPPDAVLPGR